MPTLNLIELFEEYRVLNDDGAWRDRYKAVSSQIEEIRRGHQKLSTDFVKQAWTARDFGPASIAQGVIPTSLFPSVERLLTELTQLIINNSSPESCAKAYERLAKSKEEGVIPWIPWALTNRLMAAAAPKKYCSIVADRYFSPLYLWLQAEYQIELPEPKLNWATKSAALRSGLVQYGLHDADPFLLNTFIWKLAYLHVPQSGVQAAQDNGHTEESIAEHVDFPAALNTIYYGPPGTGKTHLAHAILSTYFTTPAEKVTREEWEESLVRDTLWRDVVAAVLSDMDCHATVPQMLKHPLMDARFRCMEGKKASRARIWGNLQTHSPENSTTVHYSAKRPPVLFDKRDDGLSTWELLENWQEDAQEAVTLLEAYRAGRPQKGEEVPRYRSVTFHQSYSYEDFVEGIRPVLSDEENEGELNYELRPGIFKQICAEAQRDPERCYALFIDEINRGNIAKIFGELITLLEKSKRSGEPGAKPVDLLYSSEKLLVPANLYIIGTMNSADRSLALMDIALRRRFQFVKLKPNSNLLPCKEVQGVRLDRLLDVINERIIALYDEEHTIGHSYFWNVTDITELQSVFLYEIIPLLKEYFFDDWEKIRIALGDTQKEERGKKEYCFLIRKENSEHLFGSSKSALHLSPHWVENTEALANPTAYIAVYDTSALVQE